MTGAAAARGGQDGTGTGHEAVPDALDALDALVRLRRLLDAAPVGVAELDAAGRLVLATRTLLSLTGRRWPELRGRRWTQLAHHYDRAGVEQLWASAAPSQVQLRVTFRLATTGPDQWAEALLAPCEGGGWVLVLADAGERVAASAALVDSERWLRAVLDAVPVGLAVHTLDGRAVTVNEAMAQALGSTRDAVGAVGLDDLPFVDGQGLPVPPPDRPAAGAVRSGRPASAVLGAVDDAGRHRWLRVSAQALPLDDASLPRGVVTTVVDVSADRASERTDDLDAGAALLAASGDVRLDLAADGRCRRAAGGGRRLLGRDVDDLVGHRLPELVHPDDVAALTDVLAGRPAGAAGPLLLRLAGRDGSYGWVQLVLAPTRGGTAGTGWHAQLRDVDALVARGPETGG